MNNNCIYLLPFSGCAEHVTDFSNSELGWQIGALVLFGVAFAAAGLTILVPAILDGQRVGAHRVMGAAMLFSGTLFFYGWAFSGHPGAAWGLN